MGSPAYSAHSVDASPGAPGILAALSGAAGLAGALTFLYQGMARLMATEGGFVASGGPYEIAHPAPDWVWLVPLSILSMFAFGGLSLWASMRGWGLNPITYVWSALFISLGWNFLRLGIFDRPEGLQGAWGWIVSGVAFWAMGLMPVIGVIRRKVAAARYGPEAAGTRTGPFGLPVRHASSAHVAAQAAGAVMGIAGALAAFAAIAG